MARVLVALLAAVAPAHAELAMEDEKLVASDGLSGDAFGSSISVSGSVAVVGAYTSDDHGTDSGSAYVYRFDGATWAEEQKLLASDGAISDYFGRFVSLSGDVAVVGAPLDNDNGLVSGSAYVFRFDGTSWIEEQKLLASDGASADFFGLSGSLAGDVAVVSAFGDDDNGANSGSVYVYRFNGSTWAEDQKLLASDGASGDAFGRSVAVSGDVLVVGSSLDDDNGIDSGSAYIYRFDGSTWVEEQKLLASDGASSDSFGLAVSVSGDVVVVTAYADDDGGTDSGSAYVYRFNGSSWVEEQKLLASDGASADFFGRSVSVSGDITVVGAYGDTTDAGAVYVYRFDGTSWAETQKLIASDAASQDRLGGHVSTTELVVIAGAHLDDDNGLDSGSAYVYDLGACGDNTLDASEACDDGGQIPGDGCSATCEIEECSNGFDDDGDGLIDFGADPGCWGAADLSERSGFLPCDNGLDDDGDGFPDSMDPACSSGIPPLPDASAPREVTLCQDGIDNDGQLGTDFDGGESILGVGNGDPNGPDPQCSVPWKNREAASPGGGCGLGIELAVLLPLLMASRGRRQGPRRKPSLFRPSAAGRHEAASSSRFERLT